MALARAALRHANTIPANPISRRRLRCLLSCFFPLLRFTHPEQLVLRAELGQLPYEARAACRKPKG
jgi:hypothetical protein